MTGDPTRFGAVTVDILKSSWSRITEAQLFRQGVVQTTSSETIFARARFDEEIPQGFGTVKLSTLLKTLEIRHYPPFIIYEDHLHIIDSNWNVRFFLDDLSSVVPPNRDELFSKVTDLFDRTPVAVQFTLTESDLDTLNKSVAVLQLPDLGIRNEGELILRAHNAKSMAEATDAGRRTSHEVEILVDVGKGELFRVTLQTEPLKMLMPGRYEVTVTQTVDSTDLIRGFTKASIVRFEYSGLDLEYFLFAPDRESRNPLDG